MIFKIDFTRPHLYEEVVTLNQGNLSTNNTLRCKLVTGGSDDFTGGSIACTFTTKDSVEISGFGKLIDAKSGIVDIVFPSNALVVGTNRLEVLVNRADGGVAQSPPVMYDIWQGLTTGNGIEAETNYPILIQLINSTNEASNKANSALNKANSMITDMTDAIDNAYRSANDADIATSNANTKLEEIETAKTSMINKVDDSIANMKVETNTAIDSMVSKTDEKITDVNRAIAAGTKDLEVKEARKDASGVVHDTLEQRLKSDLIVGDKSLKDFVIDMNGMKETQDLAYETNTGYKVCNDTQVGVIKDLKLYGKSLVNELTYATKDYQLGSLIEGVNKKVTLNCANSASHSWFKKDMKNSEVWTVSFDVLENTLDSYFSFAYGDSSTHTPIITVNSLEKGHFEKTFTCSKDSNIFKIGQFIQGKNGKVVIDNICLVRNQVPNLNYFEGIASVGNGNKIEVLSRKEDGNLFDGEYFIGKNIDSNGNVVDSSSWCLSDFIYTVNDKMTLILENVLTTKNITFFCYDTSMNYLGNVGKFDSGTKAQVQLLNNTRYVKLRLPNENNSFYNVSIMNGFKDIPSLYLKQDKKPILFKDADGNWKPVTELRGIDLNSCDIIDDKVNKFYKKYNEKIFNGSDSENWVMDNISDTKVNRFNISISDLSFPNANLICDKFKVNNAHVLDTEHIGHDTKGRIALFIDKSKANDVNGLKNYLKVNPFVLQYTIKDILIYDINPLELESFDNMTLWLILSGVIAPPANFKVTSSLPNFVKSIQDQVRQLQDQVYKTNVANFTVALNTLDTKLRLDRLEAPQQ